jgi:ribosomal protein S18 acetylase RimI-like enzyme
MNYTIRKMEAKDIEQVYELGVHQDEFSTESGSFWTKEQLASWVESNTDITLVAEQDTKILGFSLYAQHLPTKKITWENLYVDPTTRGLGIGSALVQEGLKLSKELGCTYMMGCVNASDKKEFSEYLTKFGFKKHGEVIWMDLVL